MRRCISVVLLLLCLFLASFPASAENKTVSMDKEHVYNGHVNSRFCVWRNAAKGNSSVLNLFDMANGKQFKINSGTMLEMAQYQEEIHLSSAYVCWSSIGPGWPKYGMACTGTTPKKLCENSTIDKRANIYDSRVVFFSTDNGRGIYWNDIADMESKPVLIDKLAERTAYYYEKFPRIANGKVVYCRPNEESGLEEVCLYDTETGELQVIDSAKEVVMPNITREFIIYGVMDKGGNPELRALNLETNEKFTFFDKTLAKMTISIPNNPYSELFLFKTRTKTRYDSVDKLMCYDPITKKTITIAEPSSNGDKPKDAFYLESLSGCCCGRRVAYCEKIGLNSQSGKLFVVDVKKDGSLKKTDIVSDYAEIGIFRVFCDKMIYTIRNKGLYLTQLGE